ncbi:MAG: tRNA preQ1(34) S-adenosylmethionine ribosyltransferase-isomerase QueA [Woeseia sp.]
MAGQSGAALLLSAPMRASDFDYELPADLVAKYPTPERRGSRLMVLQPDAPGPLDRLFRELPGFLRAGDLLVFNDTRVIKARLHGWKESGGRVEILVERILSPHRATVQLRASKSPRAGSLIYLQKECSAEVTGREGAFFQLEFSQPVEVVLEQAGEVPLPPYLERGAESSDLERYQTVYARQPGAVAAPTAGLHFDERMMQETLAGGVRQAFVTLQVGAGTFQSLRQESINEKRLHAERVKVDAAVCDAVAKTRADGGRVVAVGTTSVRALESASRGGQIAPVDGETDLFILPGHRFCSVDALLTNFHLPRSSLLMLVAAFAGTQRILAAYRHAVSERYRFFSYGDAMLVFPPND